MKYLVKSPKTTIIRISNVEQAAHLLKCVMDSNPLSDSEQLYFNEVLMILNQKKIHSRPDCEFSVDDINSSII